MKSRSSENKQKSAVLAVNAHLEGSISLGLTIAMLPSGASNTLSDEVTSEAP